MTPAINLLKKHKIVHQVHRFKHEKDHTSYGVEAAEKLNVDPQQVFKTLVVALDSDELVVAMVPVLKKLNLKAIASTFSAKKAVMADAGIVQRTTGYVLGGVSPLGQKQLLKTCMDNSAKSQSIVYVSGGKRGLEIALSPNDLQQLTDAQWGQISI